MTSPAGSEPVALQWTLTYPAANVTSISAVIGLAAANAAKTITCASNSGSYTCIVSGLNAAPIGNGTVAIINLTLSSSATSTSIGISNGLAATNSGNGITVPGTGGVVTAALPIISSLACNPASIGGNASTTCAVTLTTAAPTGGALVILNDNSTILTVPASVSVPGGLAVAAFTASTGAVVSDQSATITATYNGSSQSTAVSLTAAVLVSSLACNPTSIGANASTTCAVTLTKPAPTGALVTLTDNNVLLSVPPSISVPAGLTSATFAASAGAVVSDQNATITATYNGSSQSATISLTAAVVLSSLTCNPTSLGANDASTCTATLTKAAPSGGAIVAVSSNNPTVTVPPSLAIAAGVSSGSFVAQSGTFALTQTATLTAAYNGSAQSASLSLAIGSVKVSTLSCDLSIVPLGGSSNCNVTLSSVVSAATVVSLGASTIALGIPSSITVTAGMSTAAFTASALLPASGLIVLTASLNGGHKSIVLTIGLPGSRPEITLSRLRSLSCAPALLPRGSSGICTIVLDSQANTDGTRVQLSSSTAFLALPDTVTAQPGESSLDFQIDAAVLARSDEATIVAQWNDDILSQKVTLRSPGRWPPIFAGHPVVRYGTRLRQRVSDEDPAVALSPAALPSGAIFDPLTSTLDWSPAADQQGSHDVTLEAVHSDGETHTVHVVVDVDAGQPTVTRVVNAATRSPEAACSPGAIASIEGKWLAPESATAPSAGLGDSVVFIDGTPAPVQFASAARIDFQCPASPSGTTLQLVVETAGSVTPPFSVLQSAAGPGIFSLDDSGSGQGLVLHSGDSTLVMLPNSRYNARPGRAGESVAIYATGLSANSMVIANINDRKVATDSITPVEGRPGLFRIAVTIPDVAAASPTVPLQLLVQSPDGNITSSNQVTIAVARQGGS